VPTELLHVPMAGTNSVMALKLMMIIIARGGWSDCANSDPFQAAAHVLTDLRLDPHWRGFTSINLIWHSSQIRYWQRNARSYQSINPSIDQSIRNVYSGYQYFKK